MSLSGEDGRALLQLARHSIATAFEGAPVPPRPAGGAELDEPREKSLDEVILDYLASDEDRTG